jgi:bifunctional DNase/RNase
LWHAGEHESNALLKEINKQKQLRPLTHDVAKNMLQAIGYKVTKIRVTDIIANTFYARIHLVRALIMYNHGSWDLGSCIAVRRKSPFWYLYS